MEITENAKQKEDNVDGNHGNHGNHGASMFHTMHMIQKLASKQNAHIQVKPNLTRYDGIRFHMKKRGNIVYLNFTE